VPTKCSLIDSAITKIKEKGSIVDRDGQCNGNKKEEGKQEKVGQHGSMIVHLDLYVTSPRISLREIFWEQLHVNICS